jgi:hypothetical protein
VGAPFGRLATSTFGAPQRTFLRGFIFIIFNVFVFWKFFISIRGWLPIWIDILLSRLVSVYCFICIGIVVGIIGGGWKIHIGGRVVGPLLSAFGFLFL